MKVLIVDDSKAIRFKLRQILEEMGFKTVCEASNGKEALKMYEEQRPDLVTLDIVMPEMNGIATLTHLKKLDPKVRVVMVTSATTVANMLEAKEAGASYFLIKPFKREKVAEVVQNFYRLQI